MIDAPLVLAFTAGLVATVNPCGFAMLPAYLAYFMGLGGAAEVDRPAAVVRALTVGAVVSGGFLLVFGVAGVAITLGFRQLITVIPWLALLIGVGVAMLGAAMLGGFELSTRLPTPRGAGGDGGSYRSVFVFGSSYAIASLSCTLPVFLSVVASAATRTDLLSGIVTFLAYGLGMSLLLLVVTLALAFGEQGLVTWLRRSAQYINRVAGGLLVAAGGYVVWFWAVNLFRGTGAQAASSPAIFIEQLSARATNFVGANAGAIGGGLAVLVAAAAGYTWLRRRGASTGSEAQSSA
jgi:cytochrome c biogenesis protein CcdA